MTRIEKRRSEGAKADPEVWPVRLHMLFATTTERHLVSADLTISDLNSLKKHWIEP